MLKNDLRLVFWELTSRCNLNCRHCRAEASHDTEISEHDTESMLKAAEDIRSAGDPVLILTGGEPLMRSDFFEIAERCTKVFSRAALASNGTLINSDSAEKLTAAGIKRVSISLDGSDASTHDQFRGQSGSFDAALRGYNALKKTGMSLQINTTVTRHNYRQLDNLLDLAQTLGADAFHLFILVPVGCGVEIRSEDRLNAEEIELCLKRLHEKSEVLRGKLHIKATCAPQYYRIMQESGSLKTTVCPEHKGHHSGMHAVTRGCLAGTSVCFVSHKGDIQPCGYLPVKAGNIFGRSFVDTWQDSGIFKDLRDVENLEGSCGLCNYKTVCMGCRARAYAETGSYLATDPDCIFSRKGQISEKLQEL
ncbi:MAG: radical SAM protein [Planctomycetota bacterium]|jgi:radical SAM protein with 4Fe4S-binding SPASM domain